MTAERARHPASPQIERFANARWAAEDPRPDLSVLIPVFRHDATGLIAALAQEPIAAEVALVLLDDGSGEPELVRALARSIEAWPGPGVLLAAGRNLGRSAGRNALAAQAKGAWWLFVDADMLPDSPDFLARWVAVARAGAAPRVVFGGFSLVQASRAAAFALHRRQSDGAECLPATVRNREPGKYVFTSNLLMHAAVFAAVPFDDGFTGWGWEDVDWGLRAAALFPVTHIDNPASHLGLATAEELVRKYRASGGNFARLALRHPEVAGRFPVMRAARLLGRLPLRGLVEALGAHLARDPGGITPLALRALGLKLMRAAVYADALKAAGALAGPEAVGELVTVAPSP